MDKIFQETYDSFSRLLEKTPEAVSETAVSYINGRMVKMTLESPKHYPMITDGNVVMVKRWCDRIKKFSPMIYIAQVSIQSGMFIDKPSVKARKVNFHPETVIRIDTNFSDRMSVSYKPTVTSREVEAEGDMLYIEKISDPAIILDYYEMMLPLKEAYFKYGPVEGSVFIRL